MMLMFGMSFVSCSSSDDDEDEDVVENEDGGGNEGPQSSYDYSHMVGYWVNIEQWNICKLCIKNGPASGQASSSAYLDDPILREGVDGYYVSENGYAYELWITATTTQYSNNQAAGNAVLKSWSCTDGKTVYFMNVSGSVNRHTCSVFDKELRVGTSYFPILNTTAIIGPNNARYEKVNLSL